MKKDRTMIFFFIFMGIGFVISSYKVTVCMTRDVEIMYSLYYTVAYNFITSIFFALPYMIGSVIYQYFKSKKKP